MFNAAISFAVPNRKLTQAHENCRKWIMANLEEAVKLMLENHWGSGEFDKV